jgi:hypothetical protein
MSLAPLYPRSVSANIVAPVENPLGVALVNSKYTHKIHNPDDLVELARQVQTVRRNLQMC